MIAITRQLNEAELTNPGHKWVNGKWVPLAPGEGTVKMNPAAEKAQTVADYKQATAPQVVDPTLQKTNAAIAAKDADTQLPVPPAAGVPVPRASNVQNLQQAGVAPAPKVLSPQYKEDLRQTFNSLPNRGKDLRIAGKDQPLPATRADQQVFDTRYKQIVANRLANPAGVPTTPPVAVNKVAPIQQATDVPSVQVNKAVQTAQTADISGAQAAGIALKKGAQATGEALGSAAKKTAEFAGEHPLAGGIAAGAIGALGLRKLLQRNKQA